MLKAKDVTSIIVRSRPGKLISPPLSLDHSEHIIRTALAGEPQLAADHILHREMRGKLNETVGGVIRQLNLEFIRSRATSEDSGKVLRKKIQRRGWAYQVLMEIALNLAGIESRIAGFFTDEVRETDERILHTLKVWEHLERKEQLTGSRTSVAEAVVEKFIRDMKKVMAGASMVARMGEEIEGGLEKENLAASFVSETRRVIQKNIYYQMVIKGLGKFGNDYAIGLRCLRHLGYVQVSTNPVLAARAYEDDLSLWEDFREVVNTHPEWHQSPEDFADEIAMEATKTALWPNLAVFRPIALLSNQHDGMVSYQLNPNVADSSEGSLKDALAIYSSAEQFLRNYDSHLMWGYSNNDERGRPNIVFKVAGGYPASIQITRDLNSLGIGTNNTVTYTVSQETTLIMAAMEGMAAALKMGISPTQAYETNMGGRLESHLRDLEAERLLTEALGKTKDQEELLKELAQRLGAAEELEELSSFEEKVRTISSYKYLKSLTNPAFVEAIAEAKIYGHSNEATSAFLENLESDIGYAGTLVAQRVYKIFFSQENRAKWLSYLDKQFGLSRIEAEEIMDKIDLLPASKRKPNDTYFTLARKNMTNTEFPNHQQSVLEASCQEDFKLSDFEDAILKDHDPGILARLLKLPDFRRAYELTAELAKKLSRVGIKGNFGVGGLKITEWPTFGSVVKTMTEFTGAYNTFREKTVDFVRRIARNSP